MFTNSSFGRFFNGLDLSPKDEAQAVPGFDLQQSALRPLNRSAGQTQLHVSERSCQCGLFHLT